MLCFVIVNLLSIVLISLAKILKDNSKKSLNSLDLFIKKQLFFVRNILKQFSNIEKLLFITIVVIYINNLFIDIMKIDAAQYASIAFEMLTNNSFLQITDMQADYLDKPPLLFWLINLGWHLFGVNDWWPRTIPFFFSLASIFLVKKIADKLWDKSKNIGYISTLLLLASSVWAVFSVVLMFDMMLTFFTCLGIFGIVISLKEKNKNGFIFLALAFGGGLLAKGPTIILQILPLALLAPWWIKQKNIQWKSWYISFAIAFLVGAGILLSWAIPAGISGGNQYQHDIFWGQTANRMVNSFAHHRPQWWYLEIAPFILFPLL